MKFAEPHPYADPEAAARKLLELANAFEPVQDGRIYIEKINGPFLFELKGTPAEYKAGLDYAIATGWLILHESVLSNRRMSRCGARSRRRHRSSGCTRRRPIRKVLTRSRGR